MDLEAQITRLEYRLLVPEQVDLAVTFPAAVRTGQKTAVVEFLTVPFRQAGDDGGVFLAGCLPDPLAGGSGREFFRHVPGLLARAELVP